MNCDLLLHWMTHIGEGSWSSFRRVVEELAPPDADATELSPRLRVSFSDLGYADFFIDGTQRWGVFPPGLGGLALHSNSAVLWGGRTPQLICVLQEAAEKHHCSVSCDSVPLRPSCIRIEGAEGAVAAVASNVGIPFVSNLASFLSQSLEAVPLQYKRAPEEAVPRNWKVRSFDLRSLTWVDDLLPLSACEYSPNYGLPRYFLHERREKLYRMEKRVAVYASAMLRNARLAAYDHENHTLTTPIAAPLPGMYTRVACLCSGGPAEIADNRLIYEGVTADLAAILLVAAGQAHPLLPYSA